MEEHLPLFKDDNNIEKVFQDPPSWKSRILVRYQTEIEYEFDFPLQKYVNPKTVVLGIVGVFLIFGIIATATVLTTLSVKHPSTNLQPTVLLISLDGFRPDYLYRQN
jgi:hypothetical protein